MKPLNRILRAIEAVQASPEKDALLGSFSPYVIPKGRVLVTQGQVSPTIYFIVKGVMRIYYTRGSEDITSLLISDGEAVCIAASFFRQKPSEEILETLEDCTVCSLSYENYRSLAKLDPEIADIAIRLLEEQLISFGERIKTFKFLSVEKRIAHYISQPSSLFRRIPDVYIATYLGTTSATFSRNLKMVNLNSAKSGVPWLLTATTFCIG